MTYGFGQDAESRLGDREVALVMDELPRPFLVLSAFPGLAGVIA